MSGMIQQAVVTGAVAAGIENLYNNEPDWMKLGALAAGTHVGASYAANMVGVGGKAVTYLGGAALYTFLAPKVADVSDDTMTRFLVSLGSSASSGIVNRVMGRMGSGGGGHGLANFIP